jgi:membrane protein required for colicin V production
MAIDGYDLVMLGILAAAAVLGYFKGMVWQLAWIAGIALSSYVALRFAGPMAPFFGQQSPWNRLIAMLALYVATSLAVWLVFRIVAGAISAIHLSAFDHQLGLLLGLAKGGLLCVVVTFFAVTMAPAYRHQIVASRSGRLVAELIVRADEYLPKDIADTVDPFVKQFEDQFRQPNGGTAQPAAVGLGAGPSPLQAMWEGVQSAAAWTGAEQGGQAGQGLQQAGGYAPAAASRWTVPQPAAGSPPDSGPLPRPTAGGFSSNPGYRSAQPAAQPQPPGRFPVGAQTPLPLR